MSKTEKAHPGIAVPGQATEAGQVCRQATTSTNDSTTPAAERQQFMVADLLLPGAENAISRRDLMSLTGFTDRELRLRIEAERRQGTPILSDCVGGYYLPSSQEERKKCVDSLRRRALEIAKTATAIEKAAIPD